LLLIDVHFDCAYLFIFLIVVEANIKTHPDRYLLIAASGGLNQQRTGVG